MHNRAFQWINHHEEHARNKLSEVDPFLGCMATSSPLGELGDQAVSDDDLNFWQGSRVQSLDEYCRHAEFIRSRMQHLLQVVDSLRHAPALRAAMLDSALFELRAIRSDFRALRDSPFAWQDIHAEDIELMSKADHLLRTLSARSNPENHFIPS